MTPPHWSFGLRRFGTTYLSSSSSLSLSVLSYCLWTSLHTHYQKCQRLLLHLGVETLRFHIHPGQYFNYIIYFGHTSVYCNALKPKLSSPLKLLVVGHPPNPSDPEENNTTQKGCGYYVPIRLHVGLREIRGNG